MRQRLPITLKQIKESNTSQFLKKTKKLYFLDNIYGFRMCYYFIDKMK